jgi:hypothetical protein
MKLPAGPLVYLHLLYPIDLSRECEIVKILVLEDLSELLLATLSTSLFIATSKSGSTSPNAIPW